MTAPKAHVKFSLIQFNIQYVRCLLKQTHFKYSVSLDF